MNIGIVAANRRKGGGGTDDPYWNNVLFLSGFEGTNGSTSFTDESQYAHAVTALGNAQISTAQHKFGSSAYLGDGTGDGLTMADSNDWYIGASNFTLETFIRFASVGDTWIISQGATPWGLGYESGVLKVLTAGGSSCTGAWSPSAGTWYHVAAERSGTILRLYVDGAMLAKTTGVTSVIGDIAAVMNIASYNSGAGGSLNGYLDETRITFGIPRYDSDSGYTVPTSAFPRTAAIGLGTYRYYKFLTSGNNGSSGAILFEEIAVAESNGGASVSQKARVSGSTGLFSGAEGPNAAINQNTGDWWQPATGGNIVFDFGVKRTLTEAIFTPHPSFLDRTPTQIEVLGSNDGSNYTSLHTFSGLTSWTGARTLNW